MRLKLLTLCTLTSLALATPAFALERSGTVSFSSRLGNGESSFVMAYDPVARSFSRSGILAFESGKKINYSLSGNCSRVRVCELSGNFTGTMGGRWAVEMTVRRQADGPHAIGMLIAPNGQHIRFDRPLAARAGAAGNE